MLRKLHKVILLKELIRILPLRRRVYLIYKLTKIKNRINKELSKLKREKLELVSLDLVGLFVKSLRRNRELLRIVDSVIRRI
jgi:hypothetical protein